MSIKREKSALKTERSAPAATPEAREKQLVALAVDLAEQQLRDGTASSQVITHFLRIGSTREQIEKEILLSQKELNLAKIKAYESETAMKELYEKAINALKSYSGHGDSNDIG